MHQPNTNSLTVPYQPAVSSNHRAADLDDLFSLYKSTGILHEPWPEGGTKPKVDFILFHGSDAIYLKFKVKEKYYRATYKQINEPVYKDSCVEFFISFVESEAYYNFEFNALGTTLVGYGPGKQREPLHASLISTIKTFAVTTNSPGDDLPFNWELTVIIPFPVFCKHHITTFQGMKCKGNFYKCGDELAEPHFLSWNNIIADSPNFHLSQYFGNITFE